MIFSKLALASWMAGSSLTAPSGDYTGSVTKLGQTINTEVDINSETSMNLIISGAIDISCSDEAYTLNGSEVTVDNIGVDGDCAHDALAENKVTLEDIKYDDSKDEITVSVKYSVLNIDVVLTHGAAAGEQAVEVLTQTPTGEYAGGITVAGQHIDGVVNVLDESNLQFTISGIIDIDCKEAYSMSGGDISIDGITTSGDCAHDALEENKVTLKSITYDDSADTITVVVKYGFLTETLKLEKASAVKTASLRGAASSIQ